MQKRFENKVALVTGASSGIGRATAIAFAKEGAKVIVSGRSREGCEKTLKMIKAAGGEGFSIRADVSKEEEVEALVEQTIKTYGKLDCAFNNAGFMGDKGIPTIEYPQELYNLIADTNIKGTWLCMKYEIPHMLKNSGGAIVNNSSVAGLVGLPGWAIYVASKHAIIGLTKSVALEYAKANIRVNAVCSGTIRTPMLDHIIGGADPQFEAMVSAAHPMGRIGSPAPYGKNRIAGRGRRSCTVAMLGCDFIYHREHSGHGWWLDGTIMTIMRSAKALTLLILHN